MKSYRSQYGQDEFLDKNVFKEKQNGVFIDIGAHDGLLLSNTYFFEKFRGWKGICVEPVPSVFEKLARNRTSININGCIAPEKGTFRFLEVSGYAEMLSGMLDFYDARHLERIDSEIKEHGGSKKIIEVPGYDINELLISNGFTAVDYCSIDTEGNEFEILKTIRFDKVSIEVFTIENNYRSNNIGDFMYANGYELIKKLSCDEVYRRKGEKKPWKLW
jgi:FkbM family methyltransferase